MQHDRNLRSSRRGFFTRGAWVLAGLAVVGVATAREPGKADLAAMLDKQRIQEVLVRYAAAVDGQNMKGFDEVFVPEATADYGLGSELKGREAIVGMIGGTMGKVSGSQHLLGNFRIIVDGDKATSTTAVQAILVGVGDYKGQHLMLWGEYRDRLERRPEGWRLVRRELAAFHATGDIGLGK
jgi:ketosteroid isomerase-like protein